MKKTIREYIEHYMADGFTNAQARNLTAQLIIISKIANSSYVDNVLLKGGVVMYNITHERRRTTIDIDFDFIRYDISNDENIRLFVDMLNRNKPYYKVEIAGNIQELHQQDYHGKRVSLLISDKTESINFKLDIGVHTLLAIDQNQMCFSFDGSENVFLHVNPPEQIFAEKLYSLAKVGPTSTRYKDADDMYYLLANNLIDRKIVKKCLELLTINKLYDIRDVQDVIDKAVDCLENPLFISGYNSSNGAWLKLDYEMVKNALLNFVYEL